MASASGIRMGKVFVEIGADPAKFFKTLGSINKSIGKFGKNAAVAGAKLSAFGAGVAAPILASAHAFAQIGSTLYDMSQRTGVAAESLSVLRFAAEQSGTDIESLETSLKKMQKAIFGASQGSKEAADALGLVGLSANDLAGLPADKQMAKIADGLMAIEDPGARAAIAMKIFGKSGTAILPMLEGGSAGMDRFARQAAKLGLVMDSETAAKADALGDAFDALSSAVRMAFVQIGSAVAPVITEVATVLSDMTAGAAKFIKNNQELVNSLLKGAVAVMAIGGALTGLGVSITLASAAMGGIGTAIGVVATVFGTILSPLGLLVAGISAVVMLAPQIKSAFSGAFDGVAEAAGFVGQSFRAIAGDAMAVFSDIAATATTTFSGIYAAIAEGDLAGAMDVLWAGLYAGWLRGVEGLMGVVDPWISLFQNTFTYLSTAVLNIWDTMFTAIAQGAVTFVAPIMGVVDNIVNSVMNAFDAMVAAVRKSWNWVQSFIKRGYDLKKENEKVDSEMEARRRQREVDRPGIEGRRRAADEQSRMMGEDSARRKKERNDAADAAYAEREQANQQNARRRTRERQSAEANVSDMSRGKRETRAKNQQFADLLKRIEGASSLDQLRELYGEYEALQQTGYLNTSQLQTLDDAITDAQERVTKVEGAYGSDVKKKIQDGAGAAAGQQSQTEVAGTFSSMAIGGMGFGSSLAQKQLDELKGIHNELKKGIGDEGAVAA